MGGERKPTIIDVARLAGASFKTVSRVINNEPHVRAETRARVLQAVADLGFQPNIQARTLAGDRSFLIAHIYGDKGGFYTLDIQVGLLDRCREAGYHLLIEEIDYTSPHVEQRVGAIVNQLRLDGVVLTAPVTDHPVVLGVLDRMAVPYVRITPEREIPEVPSVRIDERAASRTLVERLLALGHRRIGLIRGQANHTATELRQGGYCDALAAASLPIDPQLIQRGGFTFASGRDPARALLSLPDPPTALFAMNDEMAAGALSIAHEMGLVLPDELSVVGFDDMMVAQMVWPPLTTVRQPVGEMARRAADILFARLAMPRTGGRRGPRAGWPAPVPHAILPYELVERQSAVPPRRG